MTSKEFYDDWYVEDTWTLVVTRDQVSQTVHVGSRFEVDVFEKDLIDVLTNTLGPDHGYQVNKVQGDLTERPVYMN
jgi:hypothetical protein